MTLFYPADNLLVMDYNRVIKDLNGMSANEFMEKLSEHFDMRPLADGETSKVDSRHSFCLYIENKWHRMSLKPEKLDCSTPVTQLDSQILTELILAPILGITDIKRDPRIDFVGGIRGHEEIERRC